MKPGPCSPLALCGIHVPRKRGVFDRDGDVVMEAYETLAAAASKYNDFRINVGPNDSPSYPFVVDQQDVDSLVRAAQLMLCPYGQAPSYWPGDHIPEPWRMLPGGLFGPPHAHPNFDKRWTPAARKGRLDSGTPFYRQNLAQEAVAAAYCDIEPPADWRFWCLGYTSVLLSIAGAIELAVKVQHQQQQEMFLARRREYLRDCERARRASRAPPTPPLLNGGRCPATDKDGALAETRAIGWAVAAAVTQILELMPVEKRKLWQGAWHVIVVLSIIASIDVVSDSPPKRSSVIKMYAEHCLGWRDKRSQDYFKDLVMSKSDAVMAPLLIVWDFFQMAEAAAAAERRV